MGQAHEVAGQLPRVGHGGVLSLPCWEALISLCALSVELGLLGLFIFRRGCGVMLGIS